MKMKALIFDCDGVLAETERDGHRVAFNRAFEEFGLGFQWDVERYGRLIRETAGGKERIGRYLDDTGWPPGEDRSAFLLRVHERKSEIFRDLARSGALALRTGVARIVDEAHAAGVRLGVCSTASGESVEAILDLLGPVRKSRFEQILAGDVVARKKPDPEIYSLAAKRLQLAPSECMVIEDSHAGMRAALAAGMHVLVTPSVYTAGEDFTAAAAVVPELGDPPSKSMSLADLEALCAS